MDYEQPSKYIVKNTKYDDAYSIPVLTAGQSFILGYTNEQDGIYPASKDNPVIIFDDFTGSFKWVDFPFKVKSSAMKILTAKNNISVLRYIFHAMGDINFSSSEHKRLWIGIYSNFKIPIPPLPVQEEIVRILDLYNIKKTELILNLTKEQNFRNKQYKAYRDKLLAFDTSVETKALGEVVRVERGTRVVRNELDKINGNPVYQNSLTPLGYHSVSNRKANTPFVIGAGGAGQIGFSHENFWAADDCYTFSYNDQLDNRYLYFFLQCCQSIIDSKVRKDSIPRLPREALERLQIPLPSLDVQKRIVDTLDNFDKICTDLNIGLPAEIEARQKEYEFYRNELLSFDYLNAERRTQNAERRTQNAERA